MNAREAAEFAHPGWCSGGPQCWPPSAGGGSEGDQIVEVVHCEATYVEHVDGVAQVAVERFDTLHDDGRHEVDEVVYLSADGTLTARQAEAYARAILAAVGAIDAGLDGTPGGIPAVLAQLPEPWPPPGRDRPDHTHDDEQGDETHG